MTEARRCGSCGAELAAARAPSNAADLLGYAVERSQFVLPTSIGGSRNCSTPMAQVGARSPQCLNTQ